MTSAKRWSALVLALVVLVAVAVRLAFVLRLPPTIVWYDGQQYSRLALGLLHGVGYLNVKLKPSAFWPPGYPALLAAVYGAFGTSVVAVRVVQALLGGITVAFVHALAKRVLDARGAWLAAAIAALYPFHVYAAGTFFPVTLLTAQLAAVLWLAVVALERRAWVPASLAGVLGGWAALTAGSMLPLVATIAVWMAWRGADAEPRPGVAARPPRSRAAGAALALAFALPAVLVVGAWTARNVHAFGRPVLVSTNGGYNFWLGNYPGVTAETGNGFLSQAMEDEANAVWATVGNEATREAQFWSLGRRHVSEDVPRFVALTAAKAALFWSVTTETVTKDRPRLPLETVASWLSYGLLLPLALVGLARARRRDPFAVLALALAVVMTLVHAVVLAKVRFRLPLDSLVIVYGAGGAIALLDRLRGRGTRPA